MLKNYIKIAFRNLRKQKLYSLINIIGLAVGIACAIIIFLFIQDEFSFDSFHEDADKIFRVEQITYQQPKETIEPGPFFDTRLPDGMQKSPWLPLSMGETISGIIPEIANYTRGDINNFVVRSEEKAFDEEILLADSTFFSVFSSGLISGSPDGVLRDPSYVVLTPAIAEKYFGDSNPVGKSLFIRIQDQERQFTVSGVAETPPQNSSIPFSMVMRIENRSFYNENLARWNSFNTPLFVKLHAEDDRQEFVRKLNEFADERFADSYARTRERLGLPDDATVAEFTATPLTDIHLDASVEWINVSNPLYSYILGAIAVLILIIACINYVTLALARLSGRAKEVGIRKTSGANRNQVAIQFWGETQLLILYSMIIGVGLTEFALPYFNELSGKNLAINPMDNAGILAAIFGVAVLTGLIAGSYPALILSGFNPVTSLKGGSSFRFRPRLTKGLITVQYSISIFLIISSIVMFKQLDYVSSKELGYEEDQVVFVSTYTGWNEQGTGLMERYRSELSGIPGVKSVSGMAPAFTTGSNRYGFRVNDEEKASYIYYVDHQIVQTLGFELISGRNFSPDRPSDITESIIVNEALAESMGWENPIGEQLPWKTRDNPSTVIGVVRDFHFQAMEVDIAPMLFHMDPGHGGIAEIAIKIEDGMIAQTIPRLESVWAEVAPFTPFNFWFLDDAVARQYDEYRQWMKIMGISTLMAILIASMGLFGLSGITAVNKTKEIGIRKVLGAGIGQIMLLLNRDVIRLIMISLMIATPLSWFIMEQWLQDFAYRIPINGRIFVISGIATILISIVTVSYYSIKAAFANPAESLRSE
jgi:putative ABC transport system permease protein